MTICEGTTYAGTLSCASVIWGGNIKTKEVMCV